MKNDRDKDAAVKKGVLITNAFLKTDKFTEHYEWLEKAAKQYNIALSLLDNTALLYPIGEMAETEKKLLFYKDGEAACENRSAPSETADFMQNNRFMVSGIEEIVAENDFVLYWDKDILLGNTLQSLCDKKGVPVFNSVPSIRLCDHKYETFMKIWEWNMEKGEKEKIPLIPTIAAPMTYENIGYTNLDFVDKIIAHLGLPLIIKECFGSFGMQVYLAKSREEVFSYTKKLAGKPFIYQKYIRESSGKDVRMQVVGDEVAAAMYRYSESGDFRANITNGGSMKAYEPSERECELAVRTVKALGLDFAGVDLLFSKGETGEADIVCEVNSNAHFKNIYTCTGVNVAEKIMHYISANIR